MSRFAVRVAALVAAALVISSTPLAVAPTAAARTMVLRAYFVLEGSAGTSTGLAAVLRTVPATTTVATEAVRQLLAGPSERERAAHPRFRSTVPSSTRLLGIRISGGVATVNLSSAFASGGGSLSMMMRLAQLTWTVTQFHGVTGVRLQLDGRGVTTFSGEGLVLPRTLTRSTFRDDVLPAIFVDRPAFGAAMASPARITGLAHVFEAEFRIAVLDGSRRTLETRSVTATYGTGRWGRFDFMLPYHVSRAQWGWLRVWHLSEKDGAVIDAREYRVWLTP